MKTNVLRWLPAIIVAFAMQSCEKPGNAPLSECVAASIEYRNTLEGLYSSQNTYSNEDLNLYNDMPRSITVPSGSSIKVNAVWNFEKYAGGSAEIDKVMVETTVNGQVKICEMPMEDQNSLPELTFPAYDNTTFNVKFVLKSGEEHVVGPFNVTVETDNKVLTYLSASSFASSGSLLASDVSSEKAGQYYLWSPNYMIVNSAFVTHKAPLDHFSNVNLNKVNSAAFGLLALSSTGLPANQIKVVASDRIEALNLYPELVSAYGCFLGSNFARFEPFNMPIDTAYLQGSFDNYITNITYGNLDTLTFSNAVSELVLSKSQPTFKFITSAGKKGFAALSFSPSGGSLYFAMQR